MPSKKVSDPCIIEVKLLLVGVFQGLEICGLFEMKQIWQAFIFVPMLAYDLGSSPIIRL